MLGLGDLIGRRPKCKTCTNEKMGLGTVCEKFKKIPIDVQHGGYCDYYNETQREIERKTNKEREEYEKRDR